jgi:Kef-type K+ transport system membrane component KefB
LDNPLYVAIVLSILIMLASMISVELGVTVAVVEIALGVVAGNALGIDPPEWLNFLATFASVVLTAILPTLVAQRWFAPHQAQETAR